MPLPFGTGRTSPVAVADVVRVVATVLRDPAAHIGNVYDLTGPRSVAVTETPSSHGRWDNRSPMWRCRWSGGGPRCSGSSACRRIEQHIVTMARLHQENRYDRASDDVMRVTGVPAQTIEEFVAARRDFYLG